nr:TATA box-binding protein-associated factor RNA polymerase I subunit B-like isoform X1 [Lepeophtheirus salmonis]XP_040580580.1 TATA box-binding protein-associated factor RNA polymerase I subunit B-like isoform X1 [Lepeophtheirus salmonis]XP_040580588.1 TATA box-binding protein-associated factor RNA polymerase I subunit B-like isoform X1 [Lepeophtheirus salmonis]XP_040580596.1 TATA box-binding protein-associated factor RNA polymerase I subunit B-like isoform X1 [Lepeophtheirus salmonis]XP_0405
MIHPVYPREREERREKLFDSFLSGSSCKSDGNDDISFGESGTNSVITDSLETGSEFSSLASSVDDELLEDQNRIFERIWKSFSKKKKYPISVSERAYHLALPVLFALFSLALILQDDSRVCIADLLFFIECDSISFYDAFVHIPKFMRLQGNEDILRFSRHRAYRKLEPEGIKVIMYQMISLLELGNVNFGGPFMDLGSDHPNSIIERYIQEFSLPKVLSQTIRNAFKHTNLIDNLYCHKSELKNSMIPDVSIRACAIILVVLKYIYGLDDFTEHYISSTIRKMNEGKSSSECKFVIDDWVRLSRSRILLMMRHSATFFNKFKELLPRTRMCHSTYITDIRNMEESFLKKRSYLCKK